MFDVKPPRVTSFLAADFGTKEFHGVAACRDYVALVVNTEEKEKEKEDGGAATAVGKGEEEARSCWQIVVKRRSLALGG